MKYLRLFLPIAVCLSIQTTATAQESEKKYPTIKVGGVLKTGLAYSLDANSYKYYVRNARLVASGDFVPKISYFSQIEMNANGKFDVLDLFATYKPVKGLSITLGQNTLPLYNGYNVSPGEMMFANRDFVGKYTGASPKDLGLRVDYAANLGVVPVKMELGMYNGKTFNQPVWKNNPSITGRLSLGNMQGLRATAKFYNNYVDAPKSVLYYGADLRYQNGGLKVETEVMKRNDNNDNQNNLTSCYAQTAYVFPLKEKYLVKNITPAIRWDAMDYQNNGIDVNRITAGVGFGVVFAPFSSIFRINYEKYMYNTEINSVGSDLLSMELLLIF